MIDEDKADNRHFVAKLRNGKHNYPNRRELYVSFLVHNIHEIDVPRQRFHVLFNLSVAWEENKENIKPDKDDKSAVWKKEMFEDCFDPEVRVTNCMEWNQDEDETWFRVVIVDEERKNEWNQYKHLSISEFNAMKENDETKIRVIKALRFQGWFEEDFQMRDFPLDIQHLHIGVTSRWDERNVAISFDKCQPSTVASQALTSQEWEMSLPRHFSYEDDWECDSLPLLTNKTDSASGAQYCKAYFATTITRKPGHVLWNVMFIMTLVGCFSFAAFALGPSQLEARLSVILTLVLTTVAFKYVTVNMMPRISYLTMMDVVIYGCMLLQALMLMMMCICSSIDSEDEQEYFDRVAAIFLASGWLCLLIWFTGRYTYLRISRKNYVNRFNGIYGQTYRRENEERNFYQIEDDTVEPPRKPTRYHEAKRGVNRHGSLQMIRKRKKGLNSENLGFSFVEDIA